MTESPFDPKFLDQQKKKLLDQKERLEGELLKRSKVNPNDSTDYQTAYHDYGDDEESNAAEYAQNETDASVVKSLEEELRQVGSALERMDKGTYGLDTVTGKPINPKRLEVFPAAEQDINHAE